MDIKKLKSALESARKSDRDALKALDRTSAQCKVMEKSAKTAASQYSSIKKDLKNID